MTPAEIRQWAISNGFPQLAGKRGRLPKEAIEAFNNKNNQSYRPGGTTVPGNNERSGALNPGTKTCKSVLTLPAGLTSVKVLAANNYLCSGCDNKATEIVPLVDGTRYPGIENYAVLCGHCLCEWRNR